MISVTVFCSSSEQLSPIFFSEAECLAHELAQIDANVVYGGACVGLMGHFADCALKKGIRVMGVIPENLNKPGIVHEGLTDLEVVSQLMDRKRIMIEVADVVAVFPGGIGTLDEATEVLALKQLDIVKTPVVFIDVLDFWKPFFDYLRELREMKMISQPLEQLFDVVEGGLGFVDYLKKKGFN